MALLEGQWQYDSQALTLLDEEFLATLSEQKERELYARIISLDIDENPIDQIEGRITGGSINIDGTSSVRRTCSLTMVSQNIDINDFYWGVKNKFTLEIGLKNNLSGKYAAAGSESIYPDIVWFPQGYYLISSFNTSLNTNNCTVSIQGKDKMCLLNGDFGGQLFASIDFGTEEYKEKVMEQVNIGIPTSSEEISLKDYYIKPVTDFTVDDGTKIKQQEILVNNDLYVFIPNQETGNYYKDGNIYKPAWDEGYRYKYDYNGIQKREYGIYNILTDKELELLKNFRKTSSFKYYDIYKKIETPLELFYQIRFFERSNSLFIKNNNDILVSTSTISDLTFDSQKNYYLWSKDDQNNNYYPIIKVIENYEPNKYYYQEKKGDNFIDYFILDTKDSKTYNDRNYYELMPLYELYEDITKIQIPLEKIIREAVHAYAKEPYHNIIINDLENYGLEQLTYKGDIPLYALYHVEIGEFDLLIREGNNQYLDELVAQRDFQFYSSNQEGDSIYLNDNTFYTDNDLENNNQGTEYKVMKIEYGTDVGYRLTDLVYTGDLISSIGETLTSVLDKIKNMLGNFEYFYDLDGRFVFQQKPNYIETSWNTIQEDGEDLYINYFSDKNRCSFNFEGNRLFSAIQNTPVLNNLRNDFIVWGKRTATSGEDVPIHARYAIDKKPCYYQTLKGEIYTTDIFKAVEQGVIENHIHIVDWREIIYQMALDYFAGQGCSEEEPLFLSEGCKMTAPDDFLYEVGRRNPDYYPTGYTGYEQYYTDMQGFWRQLYNPNYIPTEEYNKGYYIEQNIYDEDSASYRREKKWIPPQLLDYEIDFYLSPANEDIKIQYETLKKLIIETYPHNDNGISLPSFKIENNNNYMLGSNSNAIYYDNLIKLKDLYDKYLINLNDDDIKSRMYWNKNLFEQPDTLNFWIDFLDSNLELAQFSIPQVGDRTKVINEDKVKAIMYADIPKFILYDINQQTNGKCDVSKLAREIPQNSGYQFIFLPRGFSQYFTISYRGLSAKDKIDELVYQYSYCIENITINSIPIYYLQPNTRIFVQDKNTGINGEYLVDRLTIPLTYNGTMQITAVKAPERLY